MWLLLKAEQNIHCSLDVSTTTTNKKWERGQNKNKKFSLQTFCLGAATKQNENREPGNERVNQPVTRIVISRQKALEKNVNKRAREVEVFMDDERD